MKNVRNLLLLSTTALMCLTLAACQVNDSSSVSSEETSSEGNSSEPFVMPTTVAGKVAYAATLSRNELYSLAIEELDGKTMNGIGNSSRGKTAKEYFLAYLAGKKYNATTKAYDVDETIRADFPDYKDDFDGQITWSQPKSNQIFSQIDADIRSSNHTLSMTLIQDGSQIQSKMLDTGFLLNYIPVEWAGDEAANGHPFALQSLNKVFEFNNLGTKTFKNVWDFVEVDNAPLFMGVDSEPVGKNFLYMLTNEHYSNLMKTAFDAYATTPGAEDFSVDLAAMETLAGELGLSAANAKYSLTWIKNWVEQYNQQTDDGPICTQLVTTSAADQNGLLVYSKLRAITETATSSRNNVTVAAYQDDYVGIGGFMYKHYLQVLKTSPFPYASCAFIHFMTTTVDGFSAWGADIGGYCSNPVANKDHSTDGASTKNNDYLGNPVEVPAINDRGYEWWTNQETGGQMVVEDPVYCAEVNYMVGSWIDSLRA